MPDEVKLTTEDFMVAVVKGAVRQLMAIQKKRMGHDHGSTSKRSVIQRLADSILGELGEMAARIITGLRITSRFEDTRASDLADDVEVRATEYHNGHLTIYKKDSDSSRFILMTIEEGLNATARGWILGKHAKLAEYWDKTKDPPCYWIPQHALRPMLELKKKKEDF